MDEREKVIMGLERCIEKLDTVANKMHGFNCTACPYFRKCDSSGYLIGLPLMRDALALLKALSAFKEYFDGLYGQGLDVANYHLNGVTEPFDSFYDSAMEEYENVKCADTQRDYEAAVEMAEYCERYEPTYDPETGAM